jgi:hypothetical protein
MALGVEHLVQHIAVLAEWNLVGGHAVAVSPRLRRR